MALDKQKILNELGSVVNQLQSADCGCMGKIFNQGNPNTMANPTHDGYMRGCCHGHSCGHGYQGYNTPGAGEPFSGNRNCRGFCNPAKLYADTYNYLNSNMMQPAVNEVYNDLKSISPANTMGNNPMAAQMGLKQGNNPNSARAGSMGGQMGNMGQHQMPGGAMGNMGQNQMPGGEMGNMGQNHMPGGAMGNPMAIPNHHPVPVPNVRFGNINMDNTNNAMQQGNPNSQQQLGQPMSHTPGMGPNIVNMMMGDGGNPNQGGMGNNVPQSPKMGLTPNTPGGVAGQYNAGMAGNNPGQYNAGNVGMNNMGQGNPGAPMQNPNAQYMSQPNMYAGVNATNMQRNTMNGNLSQMNPGSQQMRTLSSSPAQPQMNAHNPYGQHSAGISKFNEMFPSVMQNDLGFDPMAIAIQMNPANQQRAAMDTMQKMMMGNGEGINRINPSSMQPVINATNAAVANLTNKPPTNQGPGQQNLVPTSMQQQQQQQPGANTAAAPAQNNQVPQQQVSTALTGAPTSHQQQYQRHYQQPQQQMVDPNTGTIEARTLPTVYEGSGDPNARQEGSPPTQSAPPTTQQMIKEPIFPADASRNLRPAHMNTTQKYYQYNTLGQPVELLPAELYHISEPNLPQTLSPQPVSSKVRVNPATYSNVKPTVSKTALMGNRPVGKTPSRGQLQQIYNGYKGSQSYTQQNIRPSDNGVSYSEGHLNVPKGTALHQAPVERVGGDTAATNAINNPVGYKVEQVPGQVGDVPAANKPLSDAERKPANRSKVRNGLQDMTYTSYATSAAWSFHGVNPAPGIHNYNRFRNKA